MLVWGVGVLMMFRCGKSENDSSPSQPLLLLFISSPLCVLATERELRGFWRSEAGTPKREILDATPIPPLLLPFTPRVYLHTAPSPHLLPPHPPFASFHVSLVSSAPTLMVFLLVLQVSFLPVSIHLPLSVPPHFFCSASSQPLQ